MNSGKEKAAGRWQGLDMARGLALVAMAIYHFVWDLSFFRYIDAGAATAPLWAWFAKSIAASFLFLTGVSFALATRRGLQRALYLRRLFMITAAAFGVSIATAYAMPHAPVLFGILHCIAAVSLLMLPFIRLPPVASLALAALIFIAPALWTSPRFDGDALVWLGLNATPLSAVDHIPLLPWAGWSFLGFGLMRIALQQGYFAERNRMSPIILASRPGRALALAGRHSLAVYLLHQPVLLGLLWLGAPAPDPAREFQTSCRIACRAGNSDANHCDRYCGCVTQALRDKPWWRNVVSNSLSAEENAQASAIAAQCQRGS